MYALVAVMSAAMVTGQVVATATRSAPPQTAIIDHCLVSLTEAVHVPAQERGVLLEVKVEEGTLVQRGELLAQIDDGQAQLRRQAAQTQLSAAQAQASADIEVRYAEAAYRVAQAEYEQALEINRRVPGTIPAADVRRLQLQMHRAELQIDKSHLDRRIAQMNAEVHGAEVRAADDLIRRQRIASPLDGMVVRIFRSSGEWVNPGDPVMQVVRMDRLWVEGFLDGLQYNPGEIANRPVTVSARLAHERTVTFSGRIVFVSPLVQAGNKYRVRAEVANRMEGDQWLLRPGMNATMQIE